VLVRFAELRRREKRGREREGEGERERGRERELGGDPEKEKLVQLVKREA
jgi:hypothetical protein